MNAAGPMCCAERLGVALDPAVAVLVEVEVVARALVVPRGRDAVDVDDVVAQLDLVATDGDDALDEILVVLDRDA